MQQVANLDTGYAGEAGLQSPGHRTGNVFRVIHGSTSEGHLARDIAQSEHQVQHLQLPRSSLNGLASAPGSTQDALRVYHLVSSAAPEVLDCVFHLSQLDELTLRLCTDLAVRAKKSDSVAYLVHGLCLVPEEVLELLGTLGPSNRHDLEMYLREKCQATSSKIPLPALTIPAEGMRRNSAANTLSPASAACSSTSPSPMGSKKRTAPGERYFCPDIDCLHKPEGFTKYGYLINHVKTSHASLTENSDWEERVEIQRPGEEPPKRRKSRQHKKRRVDPSTPDENLPQAGTMVLGLNTHVPTGNFSPSQLIDEVDSAHPPDASCAATCVPRALPFIQSESINSGSFVDSQWYHPATDHVHSRIPSAPTTPTFLFDPPAPSLRQRETQTTMPGNQSLGSIPLHVWSVYNSLGFPQHFQSP